MTLTRFYSEPQLQPPVPPPAPHPHDIDRDSSAGRSDSEDDYVQQKPTPAGKATKKKVKRRRPQGDAEVDTPGDHPRTSKKRKRKPPVELDLSELPPEQGPFTVSLPKSKFHQFYSANKIRLDMKIDEILRSKKPSRPRKKKSAASEVLDSFADDEVARLRESMNTAVDEDFRANQDKMPALAKLRMLHEVVDTLRK